MSNDPLVLPSTLDHCSVAHESTRILVSLDDELEARRSILAAGDELQTSLRATNKSDQMRCHC